MRFLWGVCVNDISWQSLKVSMKPSTIILYVLVTLSLIFSLTALLLVVSQNGDIFVPDSSFISPTIVPTMPENTVPQFTPPLQPTQTPGSTHLTINYTEINRVENKGRTKVTLSIDVTYDSGDPITIDYSHFCLHLYVWRMIAPMNVGTAEPQNSGRFTLGSSHSTQTFQLDFEFSTTEFNGMDEGRTIYNMGYTGPAEVQWLTDSLFNT